MKILTLNSGSSSIKCALVDGTTGRHVFDFQVEKIGGAARLIGADSERALDDSTYEAAVRAVLEEARKRSTSVDAVAHRIVHGGDFEEPVVVDDEVLAAIDASSVLAPLHNPPAIATLRAARAAFPSVPHVAVFDTTFHRTLPPRAREYALPREVSRVHGLRRRGFHGISHAHVARAVAAEMKTSPESLRIVSCHLGNGASVAAIEYGRSVETSMGMTPLEGLVMGTRGGDLDPGMLLHLLKAGGFDVQRLERLLNSEAGLKGLTGTADFAEVEARAVAGDEDARRAIAIYAHRIRKYIGAYAAVMSGADAIAFTGGVGEHSASIRHRSAQRLDFLGAILDDDRNRDARVDDPQRGIALISAEESRVRIFVVRADEQLELAFEATALLGRRNSAARDSTIPVAVSARHAHLSEATIAKLFGAGYRLRKHADLAQLGQYAADETVSLVGPRGRIDHVRLMGPPRHEDQVEISRSDEFVLGVDAPVRLSGDLSNTPGITLEGPVGRVSIANGVICARRHIHASPTDAARLGIRHGDTVRVTIDSDGRDLIFDDIVVRVADDFQLELHLDTDEANAAAITPGMRARLEPSRQMTSTRAK
jgi:acetate kinase